MSAVVRTRPRPRPTSSRLCWCARLRRTETRARLLIFQARAPKVVPLGPNFDTSRASLPDEIAPLSNLISGPSCPPRFPRTAVLTARPTRPPSSPFEHPSHRHLQPSPGAAALRTAFSAGPTPAPLPGVSSPALRPARGPRRPAQPTSNRHLEDSIRTVFMIIVRPLLVPLMLAMLQAQLRRLSSSRPTPWRSDPI
ncbi:hypothetical protein C8Q79DRAFT_507334 [Trametes meyenii]|nr:hypothetical protein C8Q79DRAFT_507334 [Trametes meyenii]